MDCPTVIGYAIAFATPCGSVAPTEATVFTTRGIDVLRGQASDTDPTHDWWKTMQDVREGRYPTDMDGFLYVVQDARSSLERVLEGRSEYELSELRDHAGWAVKDHLYHLAAWERGMIYLLRKQPRHEGMGLDERSYTELDADGMNAVTFKETKDLPLSQVMDEFHSAHQELVNLLSSMTFEDLQRPYSHYAPGEPVEQDIDKPVLYWVFGNTAGHFEEHQAWIEAILNQSSG